MLPIAPQIQRGNPQEYGMASGIKQLNPTVGADHGCTLIAFNQEGQHLQIYRTAARAATTVTNQSRRFQRLRISSSNIPLPLRLHTIHACGSVLLPRYISARRARDAVAGRASWATQESTARAADGCQARGPPRTRGLLGTIEDLSLYNIRIHLRRTKPGQRLGTLCHPTGRSGS